MRMNQLLILALALSLTFTLPAESVPSKSWFREKYLQKTYDEYYEYTITRYKLEDNDRDVCPDIHKSSLFYAITGQHMNRLPNSCYLHKINSVRYTPSEAPPPPHALLIITVFDVLLCMKKLVYIITTSVYSLILIMLFIPFR